jgi:hypothetical protein
MRSRKSRSAIRCKRERSRTAASEPSPSRRYTVAREQRRRLATSLIVRSRSGGSDRSASYRCGAMSVTSPGNVARHKRGATNPAKNRADLGTPWVEATFDEDWGVKFWVEFVVDDFAYRLWVRPGDRDAEVVEWRVLRRGTRGVSKLNEAPYALMEQKAIEVVGAMLRGENAHAPALFAGFTEGNAATVIRKRGTQPTLARYAAVASLFSEGRSRRQIAAELGVGYAESHVKAWLQRGREQGLRQGRELTASAERILAEDGRHPLVIIRTASQPSV